MERMLQSDVIHLPQVHLNLWTTSPSAAEAAAHIEVDEGYEDYTATQQTTYLKPHDRLNTLNAPFLSSPDIQRKLNRTMYDTYFSLLEEVSRLFFAHNISFSMVSGTLIGSYVVHDILPWDDDMDFMIRYSDLPKVKKLFRNATKLGRIQVHSFAEKRDKELDNNEYNQEYLNSFPENAPDEEYYNWKYKTPHPQGAAHKFKMYYNDGQRTAMDWNWPFIDFIYFGENSTHVWKMWGKSMMTVPVPKHTFWPLQLRPFGRLWIPGPRDTDYFLKKEYRQFLCKSHLWDHMTQHSQVPTTVTCLDVLQYYPFVYREPVVDGMLEVLKLENTTIQSVVLPYMIATVPPFGIEQLSAAAGERLKL